jgi:isoleucyl-tRNA synthetase
MSNYKETLNLPKTEFPMKAGLAQREPEILARWDKEDLYGKIQAARADAPAYILHDGPPFANGDVHMGTALNKVLKDFVVKSRTMLGFRAPFVPGWDCHGLPIEFKVVKESRGLSPLEIRKRSEEYARGFVDVQREQFRRLGVLGDWSHSYLTLAPDYEAEIIRSFGRFVEKGLVYQSRKPVLWSTGAQTALAEAEVEYKEKVSPSIFVKFAVESGPWAGQASVLIWTTTPWTLPANLAIAVHPDFTYVVADGGEHGNLIFAEGLMESITAAAGWTETPAILAKLPGKSLVGTLTRHPFLDRQSPVHAAEFVTLETGSGCVHIAPGHGDDDYQLGRREGLELLSPVDDHGRFTAECGVPEWVGKNVFAANEDVIRLLGERGALLARADYTHSYPHCWRSKTPVIFRAVEQFFIKIDAIRDAALEQVDQTSWLPHWGRNRIRGTVESRPDWCISRQRTWGVPLPVFYQPSGAPILDPQIINKIADVVAERGTNAWFELPDTEWCALAGLPDGATRKNDTLDVWIDSGVSHAAVLRKREELAFPADLYLEATDQHRGWFQSSLMTSVALTGEAPYRTVLTHGFVVDVDTRAKISKSEQGGYKKPTTATHFVQTYGADLVRLWVSSVNFTDDVPFSEELFKRLSDSYRRIRNTLRILLANQSDFDPESPQEPSDVDRWLRARLQDLIAQCRDAYETLEFHKVFHAVNQFCAVELSSQYVDITKDRLYCDSVNSPRRRATQAVMAEAFEVIVKLLAPILAFTAEEAWGTYRPGTSVHLELFPQVDESAVNPGLVDRVRRMFDFRGRILQSIEAAQKSGVVSNPLDACVMADVADRGLREELLAIGADLEELFILSHLEIQDGSEDSIQVSATTRAKCERCWRHRADVGSCAAHPGLCGRCADAVGVLDGVIA